MGGVGIQVHLQDRYKSMEGGTGGLRVWQAVGPKVLGAAWRKWSGGSLGPDVLEPKFQERRPGEKVNACRARPELRGAPRKQGAPGCWLETRSWEFYGNPWEVVG